MGFFSSFNDEKFINLAIKTKKRKIAREKGACNLSKKIHFS
jgi:hypothetical protein